MALPSGGNFPLIPGGNSMLPGGADPSSLTADFTPHISTSIMPALEFAQNIQEVDISVIDCNMQKFPPTNAPAGQANVQWRLNTGSSFVQSSSCYFVFIYNWIPATGAPDWIFDTDRGQAALTTGGSGTYQNPVLPGGIARITHCPIPYNPLKTFNSLQVTVGGNNYVILPQVNNVFLERHLVYRDSRYRQTKNASQEIPFAWGGDFAFNKHGGNVERDYVWQDILPYNGWMPMPTLTYSTNAGSWVQGAVTGDPLWPKWFNIMFNNDAVGAGWNMTQAYNTTNFPLGDGNILSPICKPTLATYKVAATQSTGWGLPQWLTNQVDAAGAASATPAFSVIVATYATALAGVPFTGVVRASDDCWANLMAGRYAAGGWPGGNNMQLETADMVALQLSFLVEFGSVHPVLDNTLPPNLYLDVWAQTTPNSFPNYYINPFDPTAQFVYRLNAPVTTGIIPQIAINCINAPANLYNAWHLQLNGPSCYAFIKNLDLEPTVLATMMLEYMSVGLPVSYNARQTNQMNWQAGATDQNFILYQYGSENPNAFIMAPVDDIVVQCPFTPPCYFYPLIWVQNFKINAYLFRNRQHYWDYNANYFRVTNGGWRVTYNITGVANAQGACWQIDAQTRISEFDKMIQPQVNEYSVNPGVSLTRVSLSPSGQENPETCAPIIMGGAVLTISSGTQWGRSKSLAVTGLFKRDGVFNRYNYNGDLPVTQAVGGTG